MLNLIILSLLLATQIYGELEEKGRLTVAKRDLSSNPIFNRVFGQPEVPLINKFFPDSIPNYYVNTNFFEPGRNTIIYNFNEDDIDSEASEEITNNNIENVIFNTTNGVDSATFVGETEQNSNANFDENPPNDFLDIMPPPNIPAIEESDIVKDKSSEEVEEIIDDIFIISNDINAIPENTVNWNLPSPPLSTSKPTIATSISSELSEISKYEDTTTYKDLSTNKVFGDIPGTTETTVPARVSHTTFELTQTPRLESTTNELEVSTNAELKSETLTIEQLVIVTSNMPYLSTSEDLRGRPTTAETPVKIGMHYTSKPLVNTTQNLNLSATIYSQLDTTYINSTEVTSRMTYLSTSEDLRGRTITTETPVKIGMHYTSKPLANTTQNLNLSETKSSQLDTTYVNSTEVTSKMPYLSTSEDLRGRPITTETPVKIGMHYTSKPLANTTQNLNLSETKSSQLDTTYVNSTEVTSKIPYLSTSEDLRGRPITTETPVKIGMHYTSKPLVNTTQHVDLLATIALTNGESQHYQNSIEVTSRIPSLSTSENLHGKIITTKTPVKIGMHYTSKIKSNIAQKVDLSETTPFTTNEEVNSPFEHFEDKNKTKTQLNNLLPETFIEMKKKFFEKMQEQFFDLTGILTTASPLTGSNVTNFHDTLSTEVTAIQPEEENNIIVNRSKGFRSRNNKSTELSPRFTTTKPRITIKPIGNKEKNNKNSPSGTGGSSNRKLPARATTAKPLKIPKKKNKPENNPKDVGKLSTLLPTINPSTNHTHIRTNRPKGFKNDNEENKMIAKMLSELLQRITGYNYNAEQEYFDMIKDSKNQTPNKNDYQEQLKKLWEEDVVKNYIPPKVFPTNAKNMVVLPKVYNTPPERVGKEVKSEEKDVRRFV